MALPVVELSPVELRTLAGSSARELGAYYTPPVAASFMARWALRPGLNRVLEPSMGSGEFIRSVRTEARGKAEVDAWGVELAADTYEEAIASGVVATDRAILSDFLKVDPFDVDVVIGNPPYVRLRHLANADAMTAQGATTQVLGEPMDPAGSVWMPFVLHACRFLVPGGRLAFVLPYDFTYVRYARPLWRFLAANFGSLDVIRVHERVFPDILQDVVIFLADAKGGTTTSVSFSAFEGPQDMALGAATHSNSVPIGRVTEGERPFLEALLPDALVDLLRGPLREGTQPLREVAKFNIGYVAGDKRFFHPGRETITSYRLPRESLRPALTSSRQVSGTSLWTSRIPTARSTNLFLPLGPKLSSGERRYVGKGEELGVHRRYKTSIRQPWYVTPGVKVPDLLLPVFADRPVMLINDAGFVASNSLLAGYVHRGTPRDVAAAWYSSLTLLEVELNVHSLGGGVMVFVPQEADSVRVSRKVRDSSHLIKVDEAVASGDLDEAYRRGDNAVLAQGLGLTDVEVALVREGVRVLRHWRTGRTRPGSRP